MVLIRARTCLKCREYVEVHPNDPANLNLIKEFESHHRGHALITLDLDEIKGRYTNYAA